MGPARPAHASAARDILARHRARLGSWEFWRNHALYFCVFSVVCHWLEIPYSLFMELNFGIVDEFSVIWEYPLYPYLVYGVAVLVIGIAILPVRELLEARCTSRARALAAFFLLALAMSIVLEAGMGLILNQPDASGVYPLWDNSDLPLNILGQAWLPNDIMFALLTLAYTVFIYPALERLMASLPRRAADGLTGTVAVAFIALCAWQFSTVPF